ncbi:Ras guanine nucleotide exchange factor putative [Entamoeba histolytica]|uniref:Ras guanine nucleotide exchange factor, putative n=5 Tax=Entamoeba histolytica TaxID=5759 RepID=C4M9W1_ENTH1|nr:Ras guanine nucleotide exchange factor, putative [Entamoeba histolytica HM-1:IMSS]EAL43943.1 Ras guanine nucleotide exchange factor, putative [Entamoeba histolytica HM-1:IMSS]EMD45705.1 Ras guanine nucleotide exchange factor, putative [Entamoeba histolytica KU27]GAT98515.1 Ras guanine nucleotide exchange factor putative [Entamoeba histolytica]|eukprot:XP_649329.1 Ras guanine nucleotide exchange factor, putative [Entamoeba histolytica HM-1:IMSS]
MTSEQLTEALKKLQPVPIEETHCIEQFIEHYKPKEDNKNCIVLQSTEGNKIILVHNVLTIIDVLSEFPFNKTLWCSSLFYPVEFHEDKIFECITAKLLTHPNNTLLLALQSWIEECGVEFTEKSLSIIKDVLDYVEKVDGETLNESIEKVKKTLSNTHSNENEPTFQMKFDPAPISIDGKSMKLPDWMAPSSYSVTILNKDFLEIANQLMICEFSFLELLQPKDYYINIFSTTRPNSNIELYYKWNQKITNWVAYSIINQKNEMIREMAFKNFLQLAIKCIEIKNFNSFNSIVNGLTHYAVIRMKKTIAQRTQEENELMFKLIDIQGEIQNSNYSISYGKPAIPYLKFFLKEMCQIFEEEEEIDDTKENILQEDEMNKMIDISKAIKIGELIDQLKGFTTEKCTTQVNKQTNDFFMNGIRTMKLSNTDLLNLSMASEPNN